MIIAINKKYRFITFFYVESVNYSISKTYTTNVAYFWIISPLLIMICQLILKQKSSPFSPPPFSSFLL